MDCFSLRDYSNPHSCAHCYIGERLADPVLAQLELSEGCSVDVSVNSCLGFRKSLAEAIQNFNASPKFFWSGCDCAVEGAFLVETEWSKGGDTDELVVGLHVEVGGGLCLCAADELDDFLEGLFGVGVGDTVLAAQDVEVNDLAFVV